jgi:hypothetical protein
LQILENSDRFLLHPETKRLREELRERVGKKSREGK